MAGLDYDYTCPDIDTQLTVAKSSISQCVDEIVEDLSQHFYCSGGGEDKNNYVVGWTDSIYYYVEEAFERVRSTNSAMRDQADSQINSLEEDIQLLESRLSDYEDNEDCLNESISVANRQIEDLEKKIEEMENKK